MRKYWNICIFSETTRVKGPFLGGTTFQNLKNKNILEKKNIFVLKTQNRSLLFNYSARNCALNIPRSTPNQLLSLKVCEIGVKTLELAVN